MTSTTTYNGCARSGRARLLILVEGRSDIDLLKSISGVLHAADTEHLDLARLEDDGQIVFVPFGGGSISTWQDRFAPLKLREFHLYDAELPPETDARRRAAAVVNSRPGCRAMVTGKRSIENYLHPGAIVAAGGPPVEFGNLDCVAQLVARAEHEANYDTTWRMLHGRVQRALVQKTKRWLCREAAAHMTRQLLAESDPQGDLHAWLREIDDLLNSRRNPGRDSSCVSIPRAN